jgi:hypothetical protein
VPEVVPRKLWLSIGVPWEFAIPFSSHFIAAIVAIVGAFVNGSTIDSNVVFGGIAYSILTSVLSAPGRMVFGLTDNNGIKAAVKFMEAFFIRALAAMILCWWALGPNYPSVFRISAWIAFSVMVGDLVFLCETICNFGCSSSNL